MTPIPMQSQSAKGVTIREQCSAYSAPPGVFDEMREPANQVRKHWQPFIDAIEVMGCDELSRCHQEVLRLLRENGIAYNIHGDAQGVHRNWRLDILPLIISREDWSFIKAGLKQRHRLLNLILADLYGPRSLLLDKIIPLNLIQNHPGFLLPLDGTAPRMMFYSADLARGADGRLLLLSDRTQMPVGLGYTLENRTAMANILPDLFKQLKVCRLSRFFRTLRDELATAAPSQKDQPRIVMMTPGPKHDFYFEHSYLSSYLGYPLVQGADLTVRDGAVWLKSLDGLQRVDTIFRHIEDLQCDPLELSPKSVSGVTGLVEAERRGNVVLANPLGVSAMENAALNAFLPAAARHLLGEDLMLPSPACWWCGDEEGRAYVLANMDRLMIKPLLRTLQTRPVFGGLLSSAEKEDWKARILAAPHAFVGQEQINFSTAPSLVNRHFVPLNTLFRVFTMTRRDDDPSVLPGGIARSAPNPETHVVSEQTGGILKDIWVIANRPEHHVSLWLQTGLETHALHRTSILPSRVAENLFWVGRYAERLEALARMLRTTLSYLVEIDRFGDESAKICIRHLVNAMFTVTAIRRPAPKSGLPDIESEIAEIALNTAHPASLAATLRALTNAAYAVREHWSQDTWRMLTEMESHRQSLNQYSGFVPRLLRGALDRIIASLLSFTGLCMESMSRELGWMMLDIGRRTERSIMFIGLMRAMLVPRYEPPLDSMVMEAVLVTTENIITYRRRYRSYIEMESVLDLLLMDDKNPRSLVYQLHQLQDHIVDLPRERNTHRLSAEERLMMKAVSRLRLSHTGQLAHPPADDNRYRRIEGLLASLRFLLERTSEALSQTYFTHTQTSQQLVQSLSEPAE